MREITKEITETKVVGYEAFDGERFNDKAECEKYENSALNVVRKKLKLLKKIDMESFCDCTFPDDYIEVYDIKTEKDLDNLKQYVELLHKDTTVSVPTNMDNLTYGHEIMMFWTYDDSSCWFYGNGSLASYLDNIKKNYDYAMGITED